MEELKARGEEQVLREDLAQLCRKVPQRVVNGSVQQVRIFVKEHKKAQMLVGNKNASVESLSSAIRLMRSFDNPGEIQ